MGNIEADLKKHFNSDVSRNLKVTIECQEKLSVAEQQEETNHAECSEKIDHCNASLQRVCQQFQTEQPLAEWGQFEVVVATYVNYQRACVDNTSDILTSNFCDSGPHEKKTMDTAQQDITHLMWRSGKMVPAQLHPNMSKKLDEISRLAAIVKAIAPLFGELRKLHDASVDKAEPSVDEFQKIMAATSAVRRRIDNAKAMGDELLKAHPGSNQLDVSKLDCVAMAEEFMNKFSAKEHGAMLFAAEFEQFQVDVQAIFNGEAADATIGDGIAAKGMPRLLQLAAWSSCPSRDRLAVRLGVNIVIIIKNKDKIVELFGKDKYETNDIKLIHKCYAGYRVCTEHQNEELTAAYERILGGIYGDQKNKLYLESLFDNLSRIRNLLADSLTKVLRPLKKGVTKGTALNVINVRYLEPVPSGFNLYYHRNTIQNIKFHF